MSYVSHKDKAIYMLNVATDNGWRFDWELIVHHIIEAAKEEMRTEQYKGASK